MTPAVRPPIPGGSARPPCYRRTDFSGSNRDPRLPAAGPGPGEATRVDGSVPIAVFNVDGDLYAIDDTCTHQVASLADGWIVDCYVVAVFAMNQPKQFTRLRRTLRPATLAHDKNRYEILSVT